MATPIKVEYVYTQCGRCGVMDLNSLLDVSLRIQQEAIALIFPYSHSGDLSRERGLRMFTPDGDVCILNADGVFFITFTWGEGCKIRREDHKCMY